MNIYKVTLENGVTGEIEAETVEQATLLVQAQLDALSIEYKEEPPAIVEVVENAD